MPQQEKDAKKMGEELVSPFGGERAVFPCKTCGGDVAVVVIMGEAASAWADGDVEFQCSTCTMQHQGRQIARLVAAGDALAGLLESDWAMHSRRSGVNPPVYSEVRDALESWRIAKERET